jgi:hypothetical protein
VTKTIQSIVKTTVAAAVVLGALGAAGVAGAAPVADAAKKNTISFDLFPNPAFVDCLRSSWNKTPHAHATVVRGALNDTLTLDLYNIKPGLGFDMFTVQRSNLLAANTKDPSFKGSFGLAWYQSDIEIPKSATSSRTTIKTILLDQIFGFDPDKSLAPTNTFHLGFWFDSPEDVKDCNGGVVPKPTPFNGEHNAGPLAMISVPNPTSHLGPLCTDPKTATSCNP